MEKAKRGMLVAAMADAATATNIPLDVTHRLVVRNALSWEDVQDIDDLTPTTFEEESTRPAHPLMADVIRAARVRLEQQMRLALRGPVGGSERAAKIG